MDKTFIRRAAAAALSVLFLASGATTARAESLDGESGWRVRFTENNIMDSNFSSARIAEAVAGLQPGDDITFRVALENKNKAGTEWYMSNEILYSLEDRSGTASGGAYSYDLIYVSGGSRQVLFSSDTVGGEGDQPSGEGLHGATDALEDYIYLDTLENGKSGRIELTVGLDGETQGNSYQDTLADLKLSFAVTPAPEPIIIPGRPWTPEPQEPPDEDIPDEPVPQTPWIVKTGDYRDFTGPAAAMTLSGVGLAALALWSAIDRRRGKKGGAA